MCQSPPPAFSMIVVALRVWPRSTAISLVNSGLIDRCLEVIKAGYIEAKGELVIDREDGVGGSADRCVHLVDIRWFDAADPLRCA